MNIDVAAIAEFGERSGIAAMMNSTWGWPIAESLHFVGLSLLLGAVGIFDLRLLGVAKSLPIAVLHRLVPFGVLGFAINADTGVMFFVSAPDQYLYNPALQLKALFMLIAAINMSTFYATAARAVRRLNGEDAAPKSAQLIALISLASWLLVIVFGRLITFYRPPEHWCFWC